MIAGAALLAAGLTIEGLGQGIGPIDPSHGRWIALAGLLILPLGFALLVLGKKGGETSLVQRRGDGSGTQYQAGRDINVGDRATYVSPSDTKPILQIKKRGELIAGASDAIAWFSDVRVVNPDPHRHLSVELHARTYDATGGVISSYPHWRGDESGTWILPAVINLEGSASIEGTARFSVDLEVEYLWLVLLDRVHGFQVAQEYAPFDKPAQTNDES